MKMVFKSNQITFSNMDVINFMKNLKDFKALRVLNLEGNPFTDEPAIRDKIIRGLPQNLDTYNG